MTDNSGLSARVLMGAEASGPDEVGHITSVRQWARAMMSGLFDDWARACSISHRGKIFLDNLGIDLGFDLISNQVLRRFTKNLKTTSSSMSAGDADPYCNAIDRAVESGALYLKGRRRNYSQKALVTVFKFDLAQANRWINPRAIGGWGRFDGPEQMLSKIQAAGGLSAVLRPGALMRGKLPVVWLAFDEEITRILTSLPPSRGADAVRDALGLLHHNQDSLLCRIRIPPSDSAGIRKRRPTALDSGANLVFRSNMRDEPSGRAYHLGSGVADIRELVAPAIGVSVTHVIEPLGRLTSSPAFDWSALAGRADPARVRNAVSSLRRAAA